LQKAIASQSYAWRQDKNDTRAYKRLREHWGARAQVLLELGDYKNATVATVESIAAFQGPSEDYVKAARFMARAIPLAEADSSLTKGQKAQTVERYAQTAVDLLRQAVDKGFSNPSQWASDLDFEPLYRRPEFKRLVDRPEPGKILTG
jgi:hypothetical protein